MKKSVIILLLFCSLFSFSQDKIDVTSLFKEWKLENCERNGVIKSAEELQRQNEFITFYKNNKFKMKDDEMILNGIWKINTNNNTIELNLIELGQKLVFKIIKLNTNEFSYIHEELDKKTIFNLKPNIKNQDIKH